jgi:hypothetical protein
VGVAAAHDSQLDDANAHLVKAEALLQASDPGTVSDQAQKKYAQARLRTGAWHRARVCAGDMWVLAGGMVSTVAWTRRSPASPPAPAGE